MTPAILALEEAGVAFSVHEYDHVEGTRDFGREAATALDLDPDQVFKTLVVTGSSGGRTGVMAVTVVPVSCRLSLRAAGVALGLKRVDMCDPGVAQRVTGYVLGGISPFGQRKALPTVIDETCDLYDTIYVSGGRRGLDLGVAPTDLRRLLDASIADITAG